MFRFTNNIKDIKINTIADILKRGSGSDVAAFLLCDLHNASSGALRNLSYEQDNINAPASSTGDAICKVFLGR